MSLSNIYENLALAWMLTADAVVRPTQWYLGLSSSDPLEDGSGITPPADPAYARVAVDFDVAGSSAANNAVLEFPESTVDQGTMTHGIVFDAPTGGNMIASGLLRDNGGTPSPVNINTGQILRIPTGAFVITAD